jgi:hypothetical protein
MPDQLAPAQFASRQLDAVKAELAGDSAHGPRSTVPRAPGTDRARRPRSRRVVAFMGANDLSRAATSAASPTGAQ